MLSKRNVQQLALAQYMSELSEAAYCAQWMDRLEFDLWDAVVTGPRRYGRLDLTATHIQRLSVLSQGCAGWIMFDDNREESFVTLCDWHARVARDNEENHVQGE